MPGFGGDAETVSRRRWAFAVVAAVIALALGGCGALGPTPSPGIVCDAFALGDPVTGIVRITANETWLEAEDGQHLHVAWPPAVEIRPDGLYDRSSGTRMASTGQRLRLTQTAWDSAAGTADDPYRPGWCSFYDVF
jgi:hypothetical protein